MEFRYRAGEERDPSLLSDPAFAHPSSGSAARSILGPHFAASQLLISNKKKITPFPLISSSILRAKSNFQGAFDLKVTRRALEKKLIREARKLELERLMGMGFVRVPFKDELLSGATVIDVSDDSGDNNAALMEAVSACSEVSQSEQQASCGMKRKAAPLPVCSSSNNKQICRKTASSDLGQATTSTQLLKAHLKGNQPKATTSTQLLKAHLKGNQPKLKPCMVGPDAEVRESLPLGLKEVFMQANGRTHRLLQGVHCLWCTTCKVSCNGVLTMITHLSGKKHAKATEAAGILAR